jgi:hypothetical protein
MKRLTLHRLATSLYRCQHFIISMQKSPFTSAEVSDTYIKAKTTKFLDFATENTEI